MLQHICCKPHFFWQFPPTRRCVVRSKPSLHMYTHIPIFQMIFKSPALSNLLFQGFHLHCVEPPSDLTSSSQLEGIEDILPSDVDVIKRWIDGAAKSGKVSADGVCGYYMYNIFRALTLNRLWPEKKSRVSY